MTFLDWLERHFARLAFPRLIRYVVGLNALVCVLVIMNPQYALMLELDRYLILHGQVWRLFSWIFLPPTLGSGPLWNLMYLWGIWWTGDLLETEWGTFRLNAYYFLGLALCILSALIFGLSAGSWFLNLSLFFAVATLAPNLEILFFFVLPLKIKWLAYLSLAIPLLLFVMGDFAVKAMVVLCLGNYLIFFVPGLIRHFRESRKVQVRRARFEGAQDPSPFLHQCHVCGITEISHPLADFRVAADDNEYCLQHLPERAN